MKVLCVGDAGAVARDLSALFSQADHTLLALPGSGGDGRRGALAEVAGDFDGCLDFGARSADDVRAVREALGARAGHYVLVSSCEVYPALPRARPWKADEIDLADEPGAAALPARVRGLRGAERELRIGRRVSPWTVLRPAPIEGARDASGRAWWFVSRILDGGPIVLPDGGLPTYRHVLAEDVARALLAVIGQEKAHGRTLNVVGNGVLSYWGHAAMMMDGLERRVPFAYVPARAWREAGLALPFGERASTSFIDHSPLLTELGWVPTSELEWVMGLARQLGSNPQPIDLATREVERRVLRAFEDGPHASLARGSVEGERSSRQWILTGVPGRPASLSLTRLEAPPKISPPILRTRQLALLPGELRMLQGEDATTHAGPRAVGHAAVLELLEPGISGLTAGTRFVPIATLPCDEPGCTLCRDAPACTLGIDADGWGGQLVSTPRSHLVEIPRKIEPFALLADPLATLLEAVVPRLRGDDRPVWIAGRSVEAALAGWLVAESGRPVVQVDRPVLDTPAYREFDVCDLETAVIAWEKKQTERPSLVVETTGNLEIARLCAFSLSPGGIFIGRARPSTLPASVRYFALPPAASGRASLLQAFARLERWSAYRDLGARLGPAVPPDAYWDALMPVPFALPYIDGEERT